MARASGVQRRVCDTTNSMYDYEAYRANEGERARTADLVRLLPTGRQSILDIGARDGFFSRIFAERFVEVTALDLSKPAFDIPGVVTVAGDATRLQFPDNSFDCVFCAEVLEHIPQVEEACREIIRVARHEIIIGVPFRQDTRIGRTTCRKCGKPNPPWGHVNTFDEERLRQLFAGVRQKTTSFAGENKEASNPLSAWLLDLAGNPWGTYDQEESCIHCGGKLELPGDRVLWQKVCSAAGVRLNDLQNLFTKPHGNWIHLVFEKQ